MIEFESIGWVDVQYNLRTERFKIIIDGEDSYCCKDLNLTGYLFKPTYATYYFSFPPQVKERLFKKFPNLTEGEYDDYAIGYAEDGFNDSNIEDIIRYIRLLEKRVA